MSFLEIPNRFHENHEKLQIDVIKSTWWNSRPRQPKTKTETFIKVL